MASDDSTRRQHERSPSLEIVAVRPATTANHNRSASAPQVQPPPQRTRTADDSTARQSERDVFIAAYEANQGPNTPPCSHVRPDQMLVGRTNPTDRWRSAVLPSLDYATSFRTASEFAARYPIIPINKQPLAARGPGSASPTTAPPGAQPPTAPPAPTPQAPKPAPTRQNSDIQGNGSEPPSTSDPTTQPSAGTSTAATQASLLPPPAAPATVLGSVQAPTAALPPNPAAVTTGPHPATTGTHSAAAAHPGETRPQAIQRLHNVDIDDANNYGNGIRSRPIPQNVQADVNQINRIRTNAQGYPFRNELKKIRRHFVQGPGTLRAESDLWWWYGDTRFFTQKVWYYLATEGRGDQVPF